MTDPSKKEEKGAENISIEDMRVLFTRITSECLLFLFVFMLSAAEAVREDNVYELRC